ncbi:hypothetical protein GGI10_005975, partial [Coemansia sp. RSA 2530]
ESPASNTSDDTVHTCVAGKVAEDDGLRCESPAGNVAIGLSGVLPASNTSDEAGAAHGTSVNNTPPKVRRNSAPSVATEAASQSARRRASSNNGVIIAAPTARLDEPVSTALVATQAPTVAEASKRSTEPTAMSTVVRSTTPRPDRSSKGEEAKAVDAATNSSNEPSGSSSRAVVAEQAVGPIANTIDSVQPTVPISNGVWSGGEVATQADEPYASSDVGHGAMLINAGSQPGEPSAADTIMQDVEQPVTDMVVEEAEPLVVDAAMHDAETSNVASTSHVVVPPTAIDVEMEAVAPAGLGIEVEEGPQMDAGTGTRREEPLAVSDAVTQNEEPGNGDANVSLGFHNGLASGTPFVDPGVVANMLPGLGINSTAEMSLVNPDNGLDMLPELSSGPVANEMLLSVGTAANVLPDLGVNGAAEVPPVNSGTTEDPHTA